MHALEPLGRLYLIVKALGFSTGSSFIATTKCSLFEGREGRTGRGNELPAQATIDVLDEWLSELINLWGRGGFFRYYRISKKKERAGARSTKKNNGKKTKSLHPLIVMGKNIASQSGCMPWNSPSRRDQRGEGKWLRGSWVIDIFCIAILC